MAAAGSHEPIVQWQVTGPLPHLLSPAIHRGVIPFLMSPPAGLWAGGVVGKAMHWALLCLGVFVIRTML